MSEFHVEVIALKNVHRHPNADTLSIADAGGYPVIFRTGEYEEGSPAVYIPVDAVVPDTEEWAFLAGHRRIKAKRLRGVFSMGILAKPRDGMLIGEDVCEAMGVTKYEPPADAVAHGEDETDPGFIPVYTDIEGYRRYQDQNVLVIGEEVVLTEKLHGCVPSGTPIVMADGSKQRITALRVGDEVMGMDRLGRCVPTKVLRTFYNGRAEEWLKITGKRRNAGRGNSYFALTCTPEHRIWDPEKSKYIKACDVQSGQKILALRVDAGLTPIQKSVLLGKLLGDGYLQVHESASTAAVNWSHADKDREYVEWCARAVGDLVSEVRNRWISGYGTSMTRVQTVSSAQVRSAFISMYATGKKSVPPWVVEAIDPIVLAFWYMDDGSLGHCVGQEDRANFAVCGFSRADCDVLLRGLAKFGITGVFYEASGYSRIRLNAEAAERLFLLIAPYVPPCMQRKLPVRYRGGPGWLPPHGGGYKPMLVEQIVDRIEVCYKTRSSRYDIETDLHNYLANGVVVHNCNGRFAFREGRLWASSHKRFKKPDSNTLWWRLANKLDLATKLAAHEGIAIYGEAFGQVQDLRYGRGAGVIDLALFDALDTVTRRYLDHDDFLALARDLGLPVVPQLYRGPWSTDLCKHAEGKTTVIDADHVREGFVVKPVKERFDERVGRVILKLPGEGYLLRKGG